MSSSPKTLILGWGNPGRRDDGLGPAFVEALASLDLPGVEAEFDYQLQIEHAERLSHFDRVVFVDADLETSRSFRLERIRARDGGACFTTHHVAPENLLALSRKLFGHEPEAWVLGISGYDFDAFEEGLSPQAAVNLEKALEHLVSTAREYRWSEHVPTRELVSTKLNREGESCLEKSP